MKARIAAAAVALIAALAALEARQTPQAPQAPAPPAPAAPTGTLDVQVEPAAAVYVDGTLITANATRHEATLSVGLHRVRVMHPDYQDYVRLTRIEADRTVTLNVPLAEKAVRKVAPPPPTGRGRGAVTGRGAAARGTVAAPWQPAIVEKDLAQAVQFWKDGDFETSVETLNAVCRDLSGKPRSVGQLALAFMYLGASLVELDLPEQAKRSFALAQRTDRTLQARPTEFSRRTLAAWESARSVPADEDIELTSLVPPPPEPPPAPPEASPAEPPPPAPPADDPDAPFITEADGQLVIDFTASSQGKPCQGSLVVDTPQQAVAWVPQADGCLTEFTVPFAEVRSPAAAPRGGVLLQFRSDRPSLVLVPSPDSFLLEPGAERMTLNELPPITRVHMRTTLKRMFHALDRPWTDSISSLLVDVPVADLVDNPADYDGGIVRASGTLVSTSPKKGPYFISDEQKTVTIVPAGPALTIMRSRAQDWVGKELIVTGAFSRSPVMSNNGKGPASAGFVITATKAEPADEVRYSGPARAMTLEELTKQPPWNRELVRVIGKYRGTNSFGDLPIESRRKGDDWVIKDQTFAVWVTGKRPAGNGFALDSSSTRDLNSFWVAVTGTIENRKGYVYVKADKVELSPTGFKKDPATPVMRIGSSPRERPDIIFTEPSENGEVTPDKQLLVQFTKPMDKASVESLVQLRYVDGPPATFPYLLVTYYPERRSSIFVDPGTALVPGRTLELVFLPGVKDIDNQPLKGTEAPGGRVLRWKVIRR